MMKYFFINTVFISPVLEAFLSLQFPQYSEAQTHLSSFVPLFVPELHLGGQDSWGPKIRGINKQQCSNVIKETLHFSTNLGLQFISTSQISQDLYSPHPLRFFFFPQNKKNQRKLPPHTLATLKKPNHNKNTFLK